MIVESEKNSINNEFRWLVDYYEKHKKLEKKLKEESDEKIEESDEEIEETDEETDEETKKFKEYHMKNFDDDHDDTRKKDTPTKIPQSVRKKDDKKIQILTNMV